MVAHKTRNKEITTMNLPMLGKDEYSMQGFVKAVMPHAVRAGTQPNDFSPVGEVLGQLCANEAYSLVPVEYIQGNKVYTSWKIVRKERDISKVMAACPAMKLPEQVQGSWAYLDGVRYTVNRVMLMIIEALVKGFGKKSYTLTEGHKEVTRVEDVFLMEGVQKWEIDGLFKVADREVFFLHYPDSRGGRVYAAPGPDFPAIPTTDSGDSSACYQMATAIAVSADFVHKVWIPAICQTYGVSPAEVLKHGDFAEAVAFGMNPTGKVRGVGKKKRNLLAYLAQCQFVKEALATGYSHGYMPSKDGHANGFLIQYLAIGAPGLTKVLGGQKVYESMLSYLNVPTGLPSWAEQYIQSRDWMKAAATPVMYTSRFAAGTWLYGPASQAEMLDEDGLKVHPMDFCSHVVQRKFLNPNIKDHLMKMGDDEIKAMAEIASYATLSAIQQHEPYHWDFVDTWLATAKVIMGNGNIMERTYRGYPAAHFMIEPALDWFPADKDGTRDLPQISVSIPKKYHAYFKGKDWPIRFQPTLAPFYLGEVENGKPVLPYKATNELNRTDTPNGSLGRWVTLADSGTLATTIRIFNQKFPDSIVYTRHDAITVRPNEGYMALSRAYTAAMYEECKNHLRPAMQDIVGGSFIMGPMLSRDEVMAGANHILV